MTDWPTQVALPGLPSVISPHGGNSVGAGVGSMGAINGTTNWPSANRAYYFPFRIPGAFMINQFFWINGSVVAGNVDAGVYSFDGRRIISTGAIAQSGVSVIQVANVTDTTIGGGLFYLAISLSSATGRLLKAAPGLQFQKIMGILQQDSANPLPATATFAVLTVAPHIPVFGITRGATI